MSIIIIYERKSMNEMLIIQYCVRDKGMEWTFGVSDSPWYQGAVESLIKSVQKII